MHRSDDTAPMKRRDTLKESAEPSAYNLSLKELSKRISQLSTNMESKAAQNDAKLGNVTELTETKIKQLSRSFDEIKSRVEIMRTQFDKK